MATVGSEGPGHRRFQGRSGHRGAGEAGRRDQEGDCAGLARIGQGDDGRAVAGRRRGEGRQGQGRRQGVGRLAAAQPSTPRARPRAPRRRRRAHLRLPQRRRRPSAAAPRQRPPHPDPRPLRTAAAPTIECEMLVLGAGPGGYSAAFRSADLGMKTMLVERYATLGGVLPQRRLHPVEGARCTPRA